jgi:hypothetical protein
MPLPLVRQQNAFQIWVSFKHNPEHVIALALHPVRRRPDFANAWRRFRFPRVRLQTQPLVPRERIKIQHDVESFLPLRPVHRGQIHQHVELFFVPAITRNFPQLLHRNQHNCLLPVQRGFANRIPESRLQPLYQFVIQRNRLRRRFFRWRRRSGGFRRRSGGRSAGCNRCSRCRGRSRCSRRFRSGRFSGSRRRGGWFRCDRLGRCRRNWRFGCSWLSRRSRNSRQIRFGRNRRLFRRAFRRFCGWTFFRRVFDHRFDRLPSPGTRHNPRPTIGSQPAFLTHSKKRHQFHAAESQVSRRRRVQTQSNAPLRYNHTYPISKIPKNTNIVTKPYTPSCPYLIAQGNRKIVSTSKMTNRIATI